VEAREPLPGVRADRWLWSARFFKSRALAATACAGGKVEVNEQAVKPARMLRPGDLVRITLSSGRRVVRIVALAERRGPAVAARALYDDLTPPSAPRARSVPPALRAAGAGRPTKRERRLIERFRGRS
jgi:ribosome-associated heat shock protein Hsp15